MKRKPPKKRPIDPTRIRCLPASGFSWIDRRFVREGFIEQLSPEANLLYFFLVAVSDARGLSFYAEPTISNKLKLSPQELKEARARLTEAELVLYRYPLYQVLSLPARGQASMSRGMASPAPSRRGGEPLSLSEILQLAMKKASSQPTQDGGEEKA